MLCMIASPYIFLSCSIHSRQNHRNFPAKITYMFPPKAHACSRQKHRYVPAKITCIFPSKAQAYLCAAPTFPKISTKCQNHHMCGVDTSYNSTCTWAYIQPPQKKINSIYIRMYVCRYIYIYICVCVCVKAQLANIKHKTNNAMSQDVYTHTRGGEEIQNQEWDVTRCIHTLTWRRALELSADWFHTWWYLAPTEAEPGTPVLASTSLGPPHVGTFGYR